MPNWVRLKFGQKFNKDIIFLHKQIQRNPHHCFGFMIKTVTTIATRNFVAHSVAPINLQRLSQFIAPKENKVSKPFLDLQTRKKISWST
jgi:hypothetical protein